MKITFPKLWMLLLFCGMAVLPFSCTTNDVYPTVTLVLSANNISSDGGSAKIVARLNGTTAKTITLPLELAGSATLDVHFSLSAQEITVEAGSDSGFVTVTAIASSDTSARELLVRVGETDGVLLQTPGSLALGLVNANADRDNDGIPDILDDCPNEAGPAANGGCPWLGLLVNEVLYDPGADAAGDANGDGTRDPLADEFVELFNSNPTLDISGYTLSDAAQVRHTFPPGTILPSKGVIVVFGGGTPTGSFGGAQVQTASEGQLNLNNAGDVLTLRDDQGNTLAVFDINGLSGNPDEAYTRNPDITGSFEQHADIPAALGALFSPGVKIDGSPF